MGPTLSWHWGSVFKTTQFLRRDVIMKILGRARWDSCCCCTLGGQSLESDISQVCMLPAYNYPSSFVCRLNTIIKTQHTEPGRETLGHKQDRVTTRQSAADIISARKGNWIFVPQQCSVYHKRVLGRGEVGKICSYLHRVVWWTESATGGES